MENFYSIFNIVAAIIIGGLLAWSGYVLKPKDLDKKNKAHSKT